VSGWRSPDEAAVRRYRVVVLVAIVAFATILIIALGITILIGAGLD